MTVLETVAAQLMTHTAVRDDNPPGWVRPCKMPATHAVEPPPLTERMDTLGDAIAGFFEPVKHVTAAHGERGTPPPL